jgi:hypothetical protein
MFKNVALEVICLDLPCAIQSAFQNYDAITFSHPSPQHLFCFCSGRASQKPSIPEVMRKAKLYLMNKWPDVGKRIVNRDQGVTFGHVGSIMKVSVVFCWPDAKYINSLIE